MTHGTLELQHELRLPATRDDKARRNFVSALRVHVLHQMASGLRQIHHAKSAASLRMRGARKASARRRAGSEAVHATLRRCEYFQFYSALRVTAQDMVYQTVRPAIERGRAQLQAVAQRLAVTRPLGSLTLDPELPVPRSVSALDIHLMPGGYCTEYEPADLSAGAIYDHRLAVSSMGLMGSNLDDIGQSIARYLLLTVPGFSPRRILDLGCTVGHNTGAWKDVFPDAEVHGIDVAAPCLRYAAARARSQGRVAHFRQMNAESLAFAAGSFDVVFSSMFLHEVPRAGIARVLREAHRVLRPGGLVWAGEVENSSMLVWPESPAFRATWDAFNRAQQDLRGDPFIGRKLFGYLRGAGFETVDVWPHTFHANAGHPETFDAVVREFVEILHSGRENVVVSKKLVDAATYDEAVAFLASLPKREGGTFTYTFMRGWGMKAG